VVFGHSAKPPGGGLPHAGAEFIGLRTGSPGPIPVIRGFQPHPTKTKPGAAPGATFTTEAIVNIRGFRPAGSGQLPPPVRFSLDRKPVFGAAAAASLKDQRKRSERLFPPTHQSTRSNLRAMRISRSVPDPSTQTAFDCTTGLVMDLADYCSGI